jgi:hypothetical protein
MEIEGSYSETRAPTEVRWEKPQDITFIEKHYPVTKARFSIELLKARLKQMDSKTQKRAIKVIDCLMTGRFYR